MTKWLMGLMGIFGLALALGQDQTTPTLAEAKAEFQKQDKALNAVYAELKKELPDYLFPIAQEDQKEWVDYRDYVSEGQSRQGGEEFKDLVEYWEMAAGMTEERVKYLQAWKNVDKQEGWGGKYRDGRGGLLEIVETEGGIHFVVHVVRGPSFHVGVMGGLAKTNESMARFSIPIEDSDEECWITFLNDRWGYGQLEIVTVNSHDFHGARAYFDGKYLWMGPLTEKEKVEALRRAKLGGQFE